MSHWPYIVASYALTLGGLGGLVLVSWLRMRSAEKSVETLARSSQAKSRGAVADAEQSPLDFARDERTSGSTAL
jgi:hypothetical protein